MEDTFQMYKYIFIFDIIFLFYKYITINLTFGHETLFKLKNTSLFIVLLELNFSFWYQNINFKL